MHLEALINGNEHAIWHCHGYDIPTAYNQEAHLERARAWLNYIVEFKLALGDVFDSHPGREIHVRVKARVQPKDISESAMNEFNQIIDQKIQNRENGLL